ncbi:hypothetical protein P8452_43795 [Trifolium repens]|nr:hypothetical protein P8452_43795 [Trifolium repens]
MPEDHPKKTYGKKGIKRRKTPNKLTSKTPLDPGSSSTTKKNAPEDDHETVLKGKSKNIKTAAKQRIKRQKTPNKLTSKTPLEPASSSSTVNKNVGPEDDEHWEVTISKPTASFMLKPIQTQIWCSHTSMFSDHFDEEAMVPLNPSSPSESFSYTLPSDAFQSEPSDNDSPSPPSDGDVMGLESNDAPIDLPGPMTRSKTKKLDELRRKQIEEDSKWADSIELPKLLE